MSYTITILSLSLVAVLIAGYVSQKYLPPPKPSVVGIDLGTTYSCVGIYQAGTGEVTVLKNLDGDQCIPSVVSFNNHDILVGYKAQAIGSVENTIYDGKRFIGKRFASTELENESSRYAFKIIANKTGEITFKLTEKPQNIDSLVTPEFIGSRIILNLKTTAEKFLNKNVKLAVMSVPAEFDEMQRNATKIAAKLAGIEVLRIINEPTAAALAYGLHKRQSASYVLVVDLGGGTLDISLLSIQGGMFVTMAMAGNNHLGGQDFNERILDYVSKKIFEQNINTITSIDKEDINSLRMQVEMAKRSLSLNESAKISLPLKTLHGHSFDISIERSQFELLINDLVEKLLEPIKRVLEDVEMSPEDIDDIVLVGGSTRVPAVRNLLTKFFNKKPNTNIDPELAVVSGVSIQAGIIGGAWPLQVSAIEVEASVKKIHVT